METYSATNCPLMEFRWNGIDRGPVQLTGDPFANMDRYQEPIGVERASKRIEPTNNNPIRWKEGGMMRLMRPRVQAKTTIPSATAAGRVEFCKFCKNNNWACDHPFSDALGKVVCPVLSSYKCPICGATGGDAHTLKYCPKKTIYTPEELIGMKEN